MKRTYPESELQKACVKWFALQFPQYIMYKIPNEAKRSYQLAAAFKAQGQISGIPDLCLATPAGPYGSLYIEMKAGKGKLTQNQKEVHDKLTLCGNLVVTCNNIDDFIGIVTGYMELK